jgi:hypothetical protein
MANKYIPLWYNRIEDAEMLEDEQLGRVIREIFLYANDRTHTPKLQNRVEIGIFKKFKYDVDRSNNRYNACVENGRKGAEARWGDRNIPEDIPDEIPENIPEDIPEVIPEDIPEKCKYPNTQTLKHPNVQTLKHSNNEVGNTPLPPAGDCAAEPHGGVSQSKFDAFWLAYPKKVGKGAACTAWKKLKMTDALFAEIMAAIEKQRKCKQWRKDGGQYVPNPSTWLNQGRWEDEPDGGQNPGGSPSTNASDYEW